LTDEEDQVLSRLCVLKRTSKTGYLARLGLELASVKESSAAGMSEDPPPTIKQVVIGDEQFAEEISKKRRSGIVIEKTCTLTDVEKAICQVTQIDREELARPQRTAAVNRARELFMYVARRHTDASLREVAQRLWVRDVSTVSHGEKRITERLRDTSMAKAILKRTYSLIQA
jgi:chromosomal replication initiator protein